MRWKEFRMQLFLYEDKLVMVYIYHSLTQTAFNVCNLSINELKIGCFQEEIMSFWWIVHWARSQQTQAPGQNQLEVIWEVIIWPPTNLWIPSTMLLTSDHPLPVQEDHWVIVWLGKALSKYITESQDDWAGKDLGDGLVNPFTLRWGPARLSDLPLKVS